MTDTDWATGRWTAGRAPEGTDRLSLCIAGDWAPIRDFAPLIENDPAAVYGDLLPRLRQADLTIFNLEAPLSDTGDPVAKSGAVFKGEQRHGDGLGAVPVDAVTLGNNHVFDFGLDAFHQTLAALEARQIRWVGAGDDIDRAAAPLILEQNGIRIALVNFSEGEDLTGAGPGKPGVMGWDPDRMEAEIRGCRDAADLILVVAHCGLEYVPYPPLYVTRAFHRMADAGADVVIGHHPHVPQGLEWYKGTPLFYSLGNFIFYQPTDLLFRKLGYIVSLEADRDGLAGFEILPYRIHDRGVDLLANEDRADFFRVFKTLSDPLAAAETRTDAWNGLLHYYGSRMFPEEMATIMDRLKTDPAKGAAMLRNRITTPQHAELITDTMTRIMAGRLEDSRSWAHDAVAAFFSRKTGSRIAL